MTTSMAPRGEIERRIVPSAIELHAVSADGKAKKKLVGYGAMFGVRSEDLGGFVEEIAVGAFDETLAAGADVLARAEHDSRMLLGRRSSGTLQLAVDDIGLRYEVDLPDTTVARDLAALVDRGDVKQSSFAFFVENREDEEWTVTEEGKPLRILKRVSLVDVAPVAQPAYVQTTVSARALDTAKGVVKPMKPVKTKPTRTQFDEAVKRGDFRDVLRQSEEHRAKSYEEKLNSLWTGLCELLGYPWSEDSSSRWHLAATFDDRVIVARGYQLLSYPLSWAADGSPVFGEPTPVEIEYVAVATPVAEGRGKEPAATVGVGKDGADAQGAGGQGAPAAVAAEAVDLELERLREELAS